MLESGNRPFVSTAHEYLEPLIADSGAFVGCAPALQVTLKSLSERIVPPGGFPRIYDRSLFHSA
jgi:hypothetical protein